MDSETFQIQRKKNLIRSFLQRLSLGKFLASKGFDLYSTISGSIIRIALSFLIGILLLIICWILLALIFFNFPSRVVEFLLHNLPKIFILAFLPFQWWRIWINTKTREHEIKKIWRINLTISILIILTSYATFAVHNILTNPGLTLAEQEECEYYNEKFGGGWMDFRGEKFNIQLCGKSIPDSTPVWGKGSMGTRVRLTVFDESGALRALGYFTGDGNSFSFSIEESGIRYGDWEESRDKFISMPPSKLEWILARLPSHDDLPRMFQ
jgi:hypothetical protein